MRIKLLILILILTTLACSLTSDDQADNPTTVPTAQPIGNVVTQTGQTPTPRATSTTAPTVAPTPIPCQIRTDYPTYTVQQGDTLFSIAQRVNATVDELVAANCLSNADTIRLGQELRVPVVLPPATTVATTVPGCSNTWFFEFRSDVNEGRCPQAVVVSNAAGQDFEGGRVYYYQAAGSFAQNLIYVIYNDGTWAEYVDTWDSSQAFNDPSINPPANRYQPVAGIGKLWREQPTVRNKLGWAYEPESAFTGRRQRPNDASQDFYIDHGTRDLVLLLTRTGDGSQRWVVGGGY